MFGQLISENKVRQGLEFTIMDLLLYLIVVPYITSTNPHQSLFYKCPVEVIYTNLFGETITPATASGSSIGRIQKMALTGKHRVEPGSRKRY